MICIQKIYGFHGINRQNIEKSWYVTPVTDERRTDGGGKWKIVQCSVGPETAIILRRKINGDTTIRLGEYRALDLQLWNSGKNERSYQKYKIWLTMKFNRFCKQSPGVSLCPMLHSPPEKWDSGQVKKYINDNPCHLPWKLGYSEAIFTWILEKFVMSL